MDAISTLKERLAAHGRTGHFVHESGDHGDLWIDLDGLLTDAVLMENWSRELAMRVREWAPEVICGPQTGGARLAECIARQLGLQFVFTERNTSTEKPPVRYRLSAEMRGQVRGRRVLVIDDAINAGSAVNATLHELQSNGAITVGIGCLLTLNEKAQALADACGLPLVSLLRLYQSLWRPVDCPVCKHTT